MKSKIFFLMLDVILLIGIGSSLPTGGTVTYYGDYVVHTFTTDDNFVCDIDNLNLSILVVGGGGGGGNCATGNTAAGGGAGGVIYNNSAILNSGTYTVDIGGGGGAAGSGDTSGTSGENSSFGNSIFKMTGWGGGGGGGFELNGVNGGSGGGGGPYNNNPGGTKLQDSYNGTGYGYNGGTGANNCKGGGGGGSGQVGVSPPSAECGVGYAGSGGNGTTFNIYNGTSLYYAGGGGGGEAVDEPGLGGMGGGGRGAYGANVAIAGTANTGGGGGGGANTGTARAGGSGIVIVRYSLQPTISINLISPINGISNFINYFNISLLMNGNDLDYSWINNTYYIWYSNGTQFNKTTVSGLSTNSSLVNKTFNTSLGNYIWNSYACYGNTTFDSCSWSNSGNYTFYINSTINSETHNALTYETITSEVYTLNISSPVIPTNAYLVYNGTSYAATVTASGSNYLLSKTLQIPSTMIGSKTFYYEWNLSSTYKENTTTYNQTISAVQFGLCNATLTVPYLNITFKDESTDGWINATIPTSTFEYYLGDGSITKTLTYSQPVNKSNYQFCSLPANKTYYINPYLQYKLGTDYPQRIYDPDLGSYTNSTTNVTLYLLSSTDGIYVTFQVANQVDQLLSGVSVTSTRTIGSTLTTVASGTTGSDGTVTFWLNPDFEQNITFSKTGYTTYTILLIPTQSSYTITMSGATTVSGFDYSRGISYFIKPRDRELNNYTIYNFNYTLFSTYWDVSSFGFSLKLKNGTILASASSSSNGGIVSTNFNVSNYSLICMDYYYVVNSTYSNFTAPCWNVVDGLYTGWSIKTFFEDFNLFVESDGGIFGLDEFGRYLLIFIFIFFTIGIMSYKFGITSPVVISSMLFAIVFLFDVVIGLLPTPINAIPHSLTFLSLIIVVVLLIKEGQTG